MQVDDQEALDVLAAKGIRIPAQPRVLLELRDKIASGNYSVRTLSRIIGQDPGLVALLFKASRSPAFARGRRHEQLDQVVQVIGVAQTYNLVQAAALSMTMSGARSKVFEQFWTRSGEVAELAATIAADQVTVCNVFPDQAYMAGLFQQCGVPVLMMRFPDYCMNLSPDGPDFWASIAGEDAKFSVDHASVGYLVARHWGLPDFVCDAIRYQHEAPAGAPASAVSLLSILQLAVQVQLHLHLAADSLRETLGDSLLEEIGIAPQDLDDYVEDLAHRFSKAA